MSALNNPLYYGASQLLGLLDPHRACSRHEVHTAAQHLFSQLGLPINPLGMDNGTLALVLLCGLLREHGGGITAVTTAHEELHRS